MDRDGTPRGDAPDSAVPFAPPVDLTPAPDPLLDGHALDGHHQPHGRAVRGSALIAALAALAVLVALVVGPHPAPDPGAARVPAASAAPVPSITTPGFAPFDPAGGNAEALREGLGVPPGTWTVGSTYPDLAAVSALLQRRSQAIADTDVDGFTATSLDEATARRQAEALSQLPVASWDESLDTANPDAVGGFTDLAATAAARRTYGANAYVVRVVLSYRLRGFDRSVVRVAHRVTVVYGNDEWRVVRDVPADGSVELWDLGPFRIVEGRRATVIGLGDAAPDGSGEPAPSIGTLRDYADAADIGVRDVTRTLGRNWQQRVLIVAPGSTATLARLLGRNVRQYRQIAAVTTAQRGPDAPVSRGDRVFVNPRAFAQLGRLGRTIVLRHEITHVATVAAADDQMPTWLEEGFADYLGYRGSGVSDRAILAELTRYVAAGGRVRSLPTDSDFLGTNPDLVEAYEQSWLAARIIADTYGRSRLVAFYRAAQADTNRDGADGIDAAFRDELGVSRAQFTREWRQRVLSLAAG